MFTGIPRDIITNTLHFEWDGAGTLAAAADDIAARMDAFYTEAYSGSGLQAPYVSWTQARCEIIDLSAPTPRIPEVRAMPLPSVTGTCQIPTEVAAVFTFAAADQGGVVRQQLYNRIYIGGLANAAMDGSSAAAYPTLSVLVRSSIVSGASDLLAFNNGALDWVQYSPTTNTARAIARGWVDNSPDTQRRRSVDASARTIWL